jgi:anti-sigma B factor antagonist
MVNVDSDQSAVVGEQLRVAVSTVGSTSTIRLQGEWDLAGGPAISRAVAQTLEGRPECLVLDLSRLSFMDSCGIHVTAELWERSAAEHFRFVVIPGTRQVRRVFELCGLTGALSPERRIRAGDGSPLAAPSSAAASGVSLSPPAAPAPAASLLGRPACARSRSPSRPDLGTVGAPVSSSTPVPQEPRTS